MYNSITSRLCLGALEKQAGIAAIVPFYQEETLSRTRITLIILSFVVVLVSSCHFLVHIVTSYSPRFDIDGYPLVNRQPNPSNQLHME